MENIIGGTSAEIKKNQITEYLANYNYNKISVNTIKEDLKRILGETPAVNIKWSSEEKLNEKQVLEKIDKPTEITILFTEDGVNDTPEVYNVKFIL